MVSLGTTINLQKYNKLLILILESHCLILTTSKPLIPLCSKFANIGDIHYFKYENFLKFTVLPVPKITSASMVRHSQKYFRYLIMVRLSVLLIFSGESISLPESCIQLNLFVDSFLYLPHTSFNTASSTFLLDCFFVITVRCNSGIGLQYG